jgi:predicted phosphate transport protein (TIGR00153 family)
VTKQRWFLPETPDLLGMLREQASITVEAMAALVRWSAGEVDAAREVRDCEHRADECKRTLWLTLREAFSPPLDAEDLYTLSAQLDEVLNAAKDLTREMEVMGMAPDAATHEMVAFLAEGVGHLADAFERLGADGDATEAADAAIKSQRRVEHAYRMAMSALIGVTEVTEVMGRREAYRRLSRIADLIHAVAERVWYTVVKEA